MFRKTTSGPIRFERAPYRGYGTDQEFLVSIKSHASHVISSFDLATSSGTVSRANCYAACGTLIDFLFVAEKCPGLLGEIARRSGMSRSRKAKPCVELPDFPTGSLGPSRDILGDNAKDNPITPVYCRTENWHYPEGLTEAECIGCFFIESVGKYQPMQSLVKSCGSLLMYEGFLRLSDAMRGLLEWVGGDARKLAGSVVDGYAVSWRGSSPYKSIDLYHAEGSGVSACQGKAIVMPIHKAIEIAKDHSILDSDHLAAAITPVRGGEDRIFGVDIAVCHAEVSKHGDLL